MEEGVLKLGETDAMTLGSITVLVVSLSTLFMMGAPGPVGDGEVGDVPSLNETNYNSPGSVFSAFGGILDTLVGFATGGNVVLAGLVTVLLLVAAYVLVKLLPLVGG